MSDYDQRQDLNTLAEYLQLTDDNAKALQLIGMGPDQRRDYLTRLSAAARSDLITNHKKAILWNVERKLLQIDAELRNAGR
jgi:hypothetical protein